MIFGEVQNTFVAHFAHFLGKHAAVAENIVAFDRHAAREHDAERVCVLARAADEIAFFIAARFRFQMLQQNAEIACGNATKQRRARQDAIIRKITSFLRYSLL